MTKTETESRWIFRHACGVRIDAQDVETGRTCGKCSRTIDHASSTAALVTVTIVACAACGEPADECSPGCRFEPSWLKAQRADAAALDDEDGDE